MAKKEESKAQTTALAKIGPAPIVRSSQRDAQVPVPAFLQGKTMREAPGLSPTVDWQVPGQYAFGRYLGIRLDIGPNKSRLYDLADHKTGEVIGLWGGTILDRKMDVLEPKRGDLLLIQYVEDVKTSRGLNPARDFRVAVVPESPA